MFDTKAYLTPAEKHMLVKVMGFSLFLIDSEQVNINKLDQKRRLKFEKMDKIFHDLEIVPLFGDMQIAPFSFVKKSKHFDPSKWPLAMVASNSYSGASPSSPQANLMVHLPRMREDHLKFSSELARYSNEVTTTYKETPRTDSENRDLTFLALRGLRLLSQWTSVVTELYSWKLLHPTDHHQNKECPQDAEEYERVRHKFNLVRQLSTRKQAGFRIFFKGYKV